MSEPQPGDTAHCASCNGPIVFVGPYWDHPGEIKPRHPAIPMERHTVSVDLGKLRARMVPTEDTDLLWALLEDQHLQVQQATAEIARLRTAVRDLREINAQQQREIDAERAARRAFEADAVQLRQAALAYVRAGSYAERSHLRAELEVLATVEHPGTLLLKELTLLRELSDDLTRWREAGGDIRELSYVFETMEKIEKMKEGGG